MINGSINIIIDSGMRTIRMAPIALTAVAAITAVSCNNSSTGPLYEAEGSEENPVDLGDPEDAPVIYYGEVDTTASVYQVDVDPDHDPGYHITLTDLLHDADL